MLDSWSAGRLDDWTAGRLDGWTAGRLDDWTTGRLDGSGLFRGSKSFDFRGVLIQGKAKPLFLGGVNLELRLSGTHESPQPFTSFGRPMVDYGHHDRLNYMLSVSMKQVRSRQISSLPDKALR